MCTWLSRWMAHGDPGQDILSMDVARFGAFATAKYTSIKVPENYSRRFRLAYPNEELPAARPVRRSPIYERLVAAGAVMGANFGLEHALWFAPPGIEPKETPTYRRSEAFPIVRAECRAVRRSVGLYETTNYGKYEVTGRGASDCTRVKRSTEAPSLRAALTYAWVVPEGSQCPPSARHSAPIKCRGSMSGLSRCASASVIISVCMPR